WKDESIEAVSDVDLKRIGGMLTSFGLLTKEPQPSPSPSPSPRNSPVSSTLGNRQGVQTRWSTRLAAPQQNLSGFFTRVVLVNASSAKTFSGAAPLNAGPAKTTYSTAIAATILDISNDKDSSEEGGEESGSDEGTLSICSQVASQKARAAPKHAAQCKCDKSV